MRGRGTLAAGLLAALVVAVVFLVEAGGLDGFLHSPGSDYTDLLITHWPNAYFFRESVWRDHCWPLWNPSIFSGTPFAANPLSGVWYPPNWVVLILPITPALNLLLLAHLMLGAIGAGYLVHRVQTASPAGWVGAVVGGLAWGLTPKTWGSLGAGHVGVIYALGWLPWVIEAFIEQLGPGSRRICVRLPVLWALLFLSDPRMAAYTALLLAGLGGWYLAGRWRPAPVRGEPNVGGRRLVREAFVWACIGVLGIGLSAVQWLPLADLLPHTTRAAMTVEEGALYSLSLSQLVGFVWPHRGGFHEWMIYLGSGVLWLAILGWLSRSKRLRWGIVLACCLLPALALGTNGPLYPLLANLPGASLLRVPPRVWHLLALCVAVLAGLGAAELAGSPGVLRSERRNLARSALIMTAYLGLLGAGMWVLVPDPSARLSALWAFLWLVAAIVATRVAIAGRLGEYGLAAILALIVTVDLIWVDSSLVERMPAEAIFAADLEAADRVSQFGGRVYAPSFRPSQHIAVSAGLRIVNGVDPLQLAEYAQFLNTAAGFEGASGYNVTLPPLPDHEDPRTALAGGEIDLSLLSMLDVTAVVSQFGLSEPMLEAILSGTDGGLNIYLNQSTIPWPVVFQRVEVVGDLDEALEAVKDDKLGERVVVRGGHALDGPTGYVPATLLSSTPNRLHIEATGPGMLVVSEVAHRGWKARVDGQPVEIYRANGILRGVYLTEGDHSVEMLYRPATVFWGLGVSIASLAGLLAISWWSRQRGG